MEFCEVIRRRRTTREFIDKEITPEALERILEAAYKVPTWNHKRNWHFIILRTAEEKEKILEHARNMAEKFDAETYLNMPRPYPITQGQKMFGYAVPRQYTMLKNASVIIIPLFQVRDIRGGEFPGLNQFATIWCSVENIFLAAAAEGLSCSMRIPDDKEHEDVKKILKVPATYKMPVFIGIGSPDPSEIELEQCTPDFTKQLHYGSWK